MTDGIRALGRRLSSALSADFAGSRSVMASGLGISIRPFPLADRPNGRAFLALAAKSNLLQPHFSVTPMSPGIPPGQSIISNFILYPRGRR